MRGQTSAVRVLMDYRPALYGRGGIAVYVRELARALAARPDACDLSLWARRFRAEERRDDGGAAAGARLLDGRLPSRAQALLARLGVEVERQAGGADVVHWTDYVELPVRRAAVVATVHDVLFAELPDCYTAAMRRGLDRVTRRVVERADRILVPSQRSRAGLVAHYGARAERVDVIPHGVPPRPEARPATEHGRYVLFVGTLEPRKNLARLLAAHERAERRGAGVRLVLAGARGWRDDDLVDGVRRRRPSVVWEEEVSASRLAALYAGALALVYPSLGEGFGLPVLEAMATGLPVLVAGDTACADLAGDAGVAVDPRDVDALAEALLGLAEDPALRRRLGERGRRRAEPLTWAAAAAATCCASREATAS